MIEEQPGRNVPPSIEGDILRLTDELPVLNLARMIERSHCLERIVR